MGDREAKLSTARAAYARGDWRAAQRNQSEALVDGGLGTTDLALLGGTLWWLGSVQESLSLSEEVFHRYQREGEQLLAVRKAIDLALLWFIRGDLVISSGWCHRARRLLDTGDESIESGYLIYLEAVATLDYSDLAPLRDAARQLHELGARLQATPLTSLGLLLNGLADCARARPRPGRTGQVCRRHRPPPRRRGRLPHPWWQARRSAGP